MRIQPPPEQLRVAPSAIVAFLFSSPPMLHLTCGGCIADGQECESGGKGGLRADNCKSGGKGGWRAVDWVCRACVCAKGGEEGGRSGPGASGLLVGYVGRVYPHFHTAACNMPCAAIQLQPACFAQPYPRCATRFTPPCNLHLTPSAGA